mmetsp:Transcript_43949/g.138137  ORF Transcript_43949/g.138137 Transcript_43949/m.138137 type:complete len:258 (-) Transcript_43949:265-1038(-)
MSASSWTKWASSTARAVSRSPLRSASTHCSCSKSMLVTPTLGRWPRYFSSTALGAPSPLEPSPPSSTALLSISSGSTSTAPEVAATLTRSAFSTRPASETPAPVSNALRSETFMARSWAIVAEIICRGASAPSASASSSSSSASSISSNTLRCSSRSSNAASPSSSSAAVFGDTIFASPSSTTKPLHPSWPNLGMSACSKMKAFTAPRNPMACWNDAATRRPSTHTQRNAARSRQLPPLPHHSICWAQGRHPPQPPL